MSTTLIKMQIQGIRSFSPHDGGDGLIEFEKPLTIVVGHNGAGKTTIIESLLYATTGEYPPGASRGQAFVYDPAYAGLNEVKAFVKLRFSNANKSTITVTRLLKGVQKKSGVSVNFLDAAIKIRTADGREETTNAKCSEVDTQVPLLFGASKAVLQYVIFCHQDDSNWPLTATDAELKKRFDLIFAADQYSKALKNIKELRKEHADKAKVLKPELDLFEERKAQVVQITQDMEKLKRKIDKVGKQIESLKGEIAQRQSRIDELVGFEDEIADVVTRISSVEAVLKEARITLAADRKALTSEYKKESDAELQKMFASFDEAMKEVSQAIEAQEALVREAVDSVAVYEESLRKERDAKATLEAQAQAEAQRAADLASKLEIVGASSLVEAREMLEQQQQQLTAVRERGAQKVADLQARLASVNEEVTTQRVEATQCEQQGKAEQAQLTKVRAEIESKAGLGSKLPQLEEEAALAQKALAEMQSSTALEEQCKEAQERKRAQEERLAQAGKALGELNKDADARAALKAAQARVAALQQKQPTDALDEQAAAAACEAAAQQLASAQAQQQQLAAQQAEGRGRVSSLQDDIKRRATRISLLQGKRREYVPEDVDMTVAQMLRNFETQLQEAAESAATRTLYAKFASHAEAQGACAVCLRDFADGGETQRHVDHLKKELAASGNRTEEEELQVLVKQLRELQPEMEELARLEKEQLSAQQALEATSAQISGRVAQEEASRAAVQKAQADLKDAQSGAVRAKRAAEVAQEVAAAQREVASLQERLGSGAADGDAVAADYEQAQAAVREAAATARQLEGQLEEHRQLVRRRELEVGRLKDAILAAHNSEQSVASLQEGVQRSETALAALEERKTRAQQQLQEEMKRQQELQRELADARQEDEATASSLAHSVSELVSRVAVIEDISAKSDAKAAARTDEQLRRATQRIATLEADVRRAAEVRDERAEQLQSIKSRSGSSQERQNIQANMRFREQKKKVADLEQQLEQLQQQLAQISGSADDGAQQLPALRQEVDELRERSHRLEGMHKTHGDQVVKYERDLAKLKPDKIRKNYNNKLVELTLCQDVVKDLDAYYKALDSALMKEYHSEKMTQINRFIKELWQITYRGTDIDTIEITAESANTKRGNYKYRVTMIKGQTVMDMRGRCSAGQKVLACLCVRLALAETFGHKCGVLALDEPTTSLDVANIASLAEALCSILKSRPTTSFLVVTHDEQFVQALGREDFADHFWQVSKNHEGYSTVKQKSIVGLE